MTYVATITYADGRLVRIDPCPFADLLRTLASVPARDNVPADAIAISRVTAEETLTSLRHSLAG